MVIASPADTPLAPVAATHARQALSVLIASTLAFTVCFMVWMMFGVIGIPIKQALNLNATEFGLLTATPVLAGALVRVPLGIWTDRYVARWFPRHRQGFAMGVFGAGNSGAAVNKFVAPALVVAFGWTLVPQVYAAIMLGALIVFWLFSHSDPAHQVPSHVKFREQLAALRDPKVLKYCQYYSIVFGGYVALSLWMVQYYIGEYGLRALGGWVSDKYGAHSVTWWVMWVSWVCLFLLSYPQTELTILTANGAKSF
nr:MFS transporter [Methylibium sp.]